MSQSDTLSASLEDYLEAIYHVLADKPAARSRDIMLRLGVTGSSVTEALRGLAARKLIRYAPYEVITLTPKGRKAAKEIASRHSALCDFFVKVLGVRPIEAEKAACEMEHSLSHTILARITHFVEYLERNPIDRSVWLQPPGAARLTRQLHEAEEEADPAAPAGSDQAAQP